MPEMWMDVDAAVIVPVNLLPLLDDTDFKTIEQAVVYNSTGLAVTWNFVTTAGVVTGTAVTPTTGGAYDWSEPLANVGMYAMEIPASGGATINNDTEGFGWISGVATGVLPWRGPVIGFRAAGLNNAMIDSAYSATRGLAGTALPDAAADAAGGLAISDAGGLDLDAQIKTNIDAILVDTGTTLDGRIPAALTANGNIKASLVEILTTALTETAGLIAAGFKKFFNVATPTGTVNSLPDAVAGAAGGVFIAGTNAATTVTTALTTTFTGNLTGSVGSVTGGATAAELAKVPKSDGTATWNATALASLQSEATDALNAYDPPTNAEMEARTIAAATYATAAALDAVDNYIDTELAALITTVGVAGAGLTALATQASVNTIDDLLDTEVAALTTELAKVPKSDSTVTWNATALASIQAEATDALNAYDPPTKAEVDTAVLNVSVDEIQASALADLFNTDSLTTYAAAVAGSPVKEIADNAGGAALTEAGIADAVWDEAIAGHLGAGTTGNALNAAGSAGDPWSTPIPGAYGAGTAGKILGDNVNAPIATVQTSVNDVPTVAEFEARTLPSADYVVVSDTLAGVTTATNLTNLPAAAALEATLTAMKGATFSGATDSLEALRDRGDTAWTTATGFATPTNITAGTITTVTNLTNAPTNGDLTATMKTSVTTAATAATPTAAAVTGAVGSVTGNVGGNVVGSVGTVNALAANVITAASVAADAVTEIQSGLATSAALAIVATDTTTDIPAQITALNNLSSAQVTAAVPTAAQNADALLDRADGIETSHTLRQSLRLMLSALVGKLSGAATATVVIRDVGDTKDRITATVDADGNRTAVTKDVT